MDLGLDLGVLWFLVRKLGQLHLVKCLHIGLSNRRGQSPTLLDTKGIIEVKNS